MATDEPSAASVSIEPAQWHEMGTVLSLVEELLAELGEEGQEFAGIDRAKLHTDLQRNLGPEAGPAIGSGRFLALLAKDPSGTAIGVLTLSQSFALYTGGEYGVIDEMYVRPTRRGRGVGQKLLETAAQVARQRNWFRLDITAPEGETAERVVRFYEGAGFEFTGAKLRRLVHP